MKNFNFRKILFFLCIGLLIISCANVSYPSGGPVDTEPPKLIQAQPVQGTLHFKEKDILLYFNEYLQLNNVQTEFLCSPPLENNPEIKLLGKAVKITFQEELKPNFTYRLYFGNAIADNNEKNIFSNFSYVFSTGDFLDSMLVEGYVYNAFNLKPESGILVGLYVQDEDSIVAKEKPYYVSRTDSSGFFTIPYLQNRSYKIFALKDLNNNSKYDLSTEEIAFSKTEITPYTKSDSLSIPHKPDSLFLFLPDMEENQRILSASFLENNHLLITAKKSLISPKFIVDSHTKTLRFIQEFSQNADSLHVWIKDSSSMDTIFLTFNDPESKLSDTTLRITRDSQKKGKISILSPNFSSKHAFFSPLELTFVNPLQSIDSIGSVQIIIGNDTIYPSISIVDTVNRKVRINHNPKEGEDYKITIFGGRFTDMYNQTNDTLRQTTKVDTKEEYGDFSFTFDPKEGICQYIIQLLDEKDNVLMIYTVKEKTKLSFMHLKPGNYRLKMIEDKNNNGKWDSGDYWTKKFPETVRFFPKSISIRGNWVLEENYQW